MKTKFVYIIAIIVLFVANCFWWYVIPLGENRKNMHLAEEEAFYLICEERFEILKSERCRLFPNKTIYDVNRNEYCLNKLLDQE